MQLEGNTAMARDTGKRARKKVELPTANALLIEQRRRREHRDSGPRRQARRTADERVAKASKQLARWTESLEKARKRLARARSEKAKARLEASIARFERFISKHTAVTKKYAPIAQLAQYAAGVVAEAAEAKTNPIEENVPKRKRPQRVLVAHPTLPGYHEETEMVVDGTGNTIKDMYKRRQIDAAQRDAAERMRQAFETVYGSMGGAMDYDRVRGGNSHGMMPALCYRDASWWLLEAKKRLYPMDHRVVDLVVCRGYRIDSAAAIIFKREPTRQDKEHVGMRLREGLRQLADAWYPAGQGNKDNTRGWQAPDARSDSYTAKAGTREIPVAHAHVTSQKVFRKS